MAYAPGNAPRAGRAAAARGRRPARRAHAGPRAGVARRPLIRSRAASARGKLGTARERHRIPARVGARSALARAGRTVRSSPQWSTKRNSSSAARTSGSGRRIRSPSRSVRATARWRGSPRASATRASPRRSGAARSRARPSRARASWTTAPSTPTCSRRSTPRAAAARASTPASPRASATTSATSPTSACTPTTRRTSSTTRSRRARSRPAPTSTSRKGEYSPGSADGDKLIAHELAHVVQQRGASASGPLTVSQPGDAMEREADQRGRPDRLMAAGDQVQVGFDFIDRRVMAAVERVASSDPNPADPFRGLYISDDRALELTRGDSVSDADDRLAHVTQRARARPARRRRARDLRRAGAQPALRPPLRVPAGRRHAQAPEPAARRPPAQRRRRLAPPT